MEQEKYRTFTLSIPQHWILRMAIKISILIGLALVSPFYFAYVTGVTADSDLKAAKIRAEAKKIMGECP